MRCLGLFSAIFNSVDWRSAWVQSRRRWPWIAGICLAIPALLAVLTFWQAGRVRDESAREVAANSALPFREQVLNLTAPSGVEPVAAVPHYRDIAALRDSVVVSAAAGLYLYNSAGTLTRTWRTGLELPPCEPGSISTGIAAGSAAPEAFIATQGAGLLAFDGSRIRQILPDKPALRTITAVLVLGSGRVLFGTEHNGVFAYDGHRIEPFADGLETQFITALAGGEGDVWVGTLRHGVYHYHAGQLDNLSAALPDPQALSIAVSGSAAYVGTPLGVVEFRDGRRTRLLAGGFFARSVSARANALAVGTEDEGIVDLPLESRRFPADRPDSITPSGAVESIREIAGERYAVTASAVYRFDADRGWRQALTSPPAALAARNVAALGFSTGSLWVGYFDAGLDVLGAGLARAAHYEDDTLFCINRIVADPSSQRTAVATANGLVLFDAAGRQRQVLGRKDGLLADHVTDVAFRNGGMVVATPAGLSFVDSGGVRSLYVFQGLVNNHVYAVGAAGAEVVAGTLGGVSVLDNETILANYTTANSGLRHNWVTAVAQVDDQWFAGTYGAGVQRLSPDGRWITFPDLKPGLVVNPAALLVTAHRVFAGSLGQGLFVYGRGSQRWTNFTRGLPSLNVTALAESGGFLYVGTENGLVRMPEEALP
jgi:ligand-binding sensor domain-containing protein